MLVTTRAAAPRSGDGLDARRRGRGGGDRRRQRGAAVGARLGAAAAARLPGRAALGAAAGGASAAPAASARRRWPTRRRCGQRRVRGLVVGEEVPPGGVDRVRVGQVLLVDLVDEPLVGAEAGQRVARHGGTRQT